MFREKGKELVPGQADSKHVPKLFRQRNHLFAVIFYSKLTFTGHERLGVWGPCSFFFPTLVVKMVTGFD